jgi:hypothetical protein
MEITMTLRSLTLALCLLAPPAFAEPFVLVIYETPEQLALREDQGAAGHAYWGSFAAFGTEAKTAGILRGGAALIPVPTATIGTLEPGALTFSGFFQIDVPTAQDARLWAQKVPAAATGAVEVRSTVKLPNM